MASSTSSPQQQCNLHPSKPFNGFCAACLRQRLRSRSLFDEKETVNFGVESQNGTESSTIGREIEERRRLGAKDATFIDFGDEMDVSLQREIEERRRLGGNDAVDFSIETGSRDSLQRGVKNFPIGREIEERRQLGAKDTIDFGAELGFSSKQGKKFSKIGREIEEMRRIEVKDLSLIKNCIDREIEETRQTGVEDLSLIKDCGDLDNVSIFSSKLEKNPSTKGRENTEERWQLRRNEREMKAIKDHIDVDLDSSSSSRGFVGGFANMFGKKIQNWRKKHKLKRQCSKGKMSVENFEKPEMGLNSLGRRSCDIEPRFSMECGRMSLDEPRASWDGFLFGGRSVLSRPNPMVENPDVVDLVKRSDGLIPVEEDDRMPGGSAQTREYYLHSSSRRSRRSLDRSSSVREQPAELNELRSMFNAKVTPASGGTSELFSSNRGGLLDQELKDWRSNLGKDDCFGSFESVVKDINKGKKKSGIWSKSWNFLGFLSRKNSTKESVDKNSSDSWTNQRSRSYNGKLSNDGVNIGARHSFSSSVGYGSMKRSNLDINGHTAKKRGEVVLDRSRSARFSPCHNDNGLLRFYLTPIRNSWRNGGGSGSSRRISSHCLRKTVLGLY